MFKNIGLTKSILRHADVANMSVSEWVTATRFDSTDWGWIIMSIGMAIGAGIVFLPVKVGLVGLWVFLISAFIAYPAMYLFQKLFINTLVASKQCEDYPSVISAYLGENWGFLLGTLYFIMLLIWVFVYSTAITNDSASFLHSFHVTKTVLSSNPLYSLTVISLLVTIASRAEKILFKISSFMVCTKLIIVLILGVTMVGLWNIHNVSVFPNLGYLVKQTIILLPYTLTSILFLQSLSPMVISFRAHNKNIEVARYKALRAMNTAFFILFVVVFFYAISFNLALGHDQAVEAYRQNISTLAIAAQSMKGSSIKIFSLILNIFAVVTAFFGVFLGFRESCQGIIINLLSRVIPKKKLNKRIISWFTVVFTVFIAWLAVLLNIPVLSFTSICSPVFGLIGCLIPVYLVYKVPSLYKLKTPSLWLIIFVGILLVVSPFFAFM